MTEHPQMQPPDYHRCVTTMLSTPAACLELLDTLSTMTEAEARYKWSPWRGQPPPMRGPEVMAHIPAEVRLVAVEAQLAGERKSSMALWRELAEIMGVGVMDLSLAELIGFVGRRLQRLEARVEELEARP